MLAVACTGMHDQSRWLVYDDHIPVGMDDIERNRLFCPGFVRPFKLSADINGFAALDHVPLSGNDIIYHHISGLDPALQA